MVKTKISNVDSHLFWKVAVGDRGEFFALRSNCDSLIAVLVKAIDGTFIESSREKHVDHCLEVSIFLEQELVRLKRNKAKLVEFDELLLQSRVLKTQHFVEVDLLWRLDIYVLEGDHALSEVVWLWLLDIDDTWNGWWILWAELGHSNIVVHWLIEITLFLLDFVQELHWLINILGRLGDHDIDLDFVAEFDVTTLESEEGGVSSWKLWSCEIHSECPLRFWHDLAFHCIEASINLITSGLAEDDVLWPCN